MEVILIFRQLSEKEQVALLKRDTSRLQINYLPGITVSIPAPTKAIPDEIVKKASLDLISKLKELGDYSINGQSVSEILTIEEIPLWHYQRFRVFFLLKKEWIINQCIKSYLTGNSHLTCYVPDDVVINDYLNKEVLVIRNEKANHLKAGGRLKAKINFKTLLNYAVFFFLRVLTGLLKFNKTSQKTHLLIDRSIRQKCRHITTLQPKLDNYNLSPLFDSSKSEFLIISEVETPKFSSSTPFMLHNYYFNGEGRWNRTIYGESILFKGLLSFSVLKKRKQIFKKFLKEAASVQQHLIESFHSNVSNSTESDPNFNCSQYSALFSEFLSLTKSSGFYVFKYLCYQRYFSKYSFRTITAIDENSPATKCILDAARSLSIKSIGIQHGNIGNAQPAYMYSEKDRRNHVMADMTIVWGSYWSEFLIKYANYPPDSIKIAGQMRSDLIPAMQSMSNEFKQNLGNFSHIALFASQPIPDADYRFQMAYNVYKCFRRFPNVKLVQKLHPAERHDTSYYRGIAAKAGNPEVDIYYDIDLYEVLAASDFVITAFSTVGSEAVYFGKPLIIYDPLKEDLLKYVHESVAFQAIDSENLMELVEGILNGTLKVDKDKYKQFINKYAFSIDGKATERTIRFIQEV